MASSDLTYACSFELQACKSSELRPQVADLAVQSSFMQDLGCCMGQTGVASRVQETCTPLPHLCLAARMCIKMQSCMKSRRIHAQRIRDNLSA